MKKFSGFMLMLLLAFELIAQDPYFSQFYANPLYTNPAFAGTAHTNEASAGRASVNYRNQWNGAFRTVCVGMDQAIDAIKGAFGLQYLNDYINHGLITSKALNGVYAIKFKLGEKLHLRIGIQGGVVHRSLDLSKLQFADNIFSTPGYYPNTNAKNTSVSYFNLGSGILVTNENLFFGIAVHNVLEPNWSFYDYSNDVQPRHITSHWGYNFTIGQEIQITPQAIFEYQHTSSKLLGGALVKRKNWCAGVWYRQTFGFFRNTNTVILNFGAMVKGFRLNYSYDMPIADGLYAIPHSHEISLHYCWKTKQSGALFSKALY